MAPVIWAGSIHRARSWTSPLAAISSSRCEPTFCGGPSRSAARRNPPDLCVWSTTPIVRCAFSHASSSVSATMGRNVTQVRGTSVRPASLACAATRSICSRVSASGSPQSPKMSPRAPPTRYASSLDPPMETGIVPPAGRNPATKFSNR